jgi:hypothetical protein
MQFKIPTEGGDDEINMAPMIDMVFLLLVFFMCTCHQNQVENFRLDIPTASKAVVPKEKPGRWTVNILQNGDVFEGSGRIDIETLKKSDDVGYKRRHVGDKYKTGGMVNPNSSVKKQVVPGSRGVKSGMNSKVTASKVAKGRVGGTSTAPKKAIPKAKIGGMMRMKKK